MRKREHAKILKLSESEKEMLKKVAEYYKLNESDVIRMLINREYTKITEQEKKG